MILEKFDLKSYLEQRRLLINDHLERVVSLCGREKEVVQAMLHSLMAGGKRLRPVLCLASAEVSGCDPLLALPAACAMEMIHTYSLIHDDLPAMDDDDLRRGIPTCHKKFSEATAILAGDGLLTFAFKVLASPQSFFDTFPAPPALLRIISVISDVAGVNGMIQGQMLDMKSEGATCSGQEDRAKLLERLESMHRLKTGRMITGSIEAGAIAGNADPFMVERLTSYADKIGLAFQVTDDILNVEGDPEIMGKAVGSDVLHDKLTFPALLGMEASRNLVEKLVSEAISALPSDNAACRPLAAIANYIRDRKR